MENMYQNESQSERNLWDYMNLHRQLPADDRQLFDAWIEDFKKLPLCTQKIMIKFIKDFPRRCKPL